MQRGGHQRCRSICPADVKRRMSLEQLSQAVIIPAFDRSEKSMLGRRRPHASAVKHDKRANQRLCDYSAQRSRKIHTCLDSRSRCETQQLCHRARDLIRPATKQCEIGLEFHRLFLENSRAIGGFTPATAIRRLYNDGRAVMYRLLRSNHQSRIVGDSGINAIRFIYSSTADVRFN